MCGLISLVFAGMIIIATMDSNDVGYFNRNYFGLSHAHARCSWGVGVGGEKQRE